MRGVSTKPLLRRGHRPRPTVWGVAGAVVAFCAVVAAWWLWPTGERAGETPQPQTKQRIKEVKPKVTERQMLSQTHAEKTAKRSDLEISLEVSPKQTADTNQLEGVTENAKRKKVVKPRYRSTTEFVLAMLFSTKLGDPAPPLPPIPDHELDKLAEILERETTVSPEDGPTMRERKAICDLAKKELKKFLLEGGVDTEFFDYYRHKLNSYNREWTKSQTMVDNLYNDGHVEEARSLADKINEDFEKRGFRNVSVPE